jgi:hypothetical protein
MPGAKAFPFANWTGWWIDLLAEMLAGHCTLRGVWDPHRAATGGRRKSSTVFGFKRLRNFCWQATVFYIIYADHGPLSRPLRPFGAASDLLVFGRDAKIDAQEIVF